MIRPEPFGIIESIPYVRRVPRAHLVRGGEPLAAFRCTPTDIFDVDPENAWIELDIYGTTEAGMYRAEMYLVDLDLAFHLDCRSGCPSTRVDEIQKTYAQKIHQSFSLGIPEEIFRAGVYLHMLFCVRLIMRTKDKRVFLDLFSRTIAQNEKQHALRRDVITLLAEVGLLKGFTQQEMQETNDRICRNIRAAQIIS